MKKEMQSGLSVVELVVAMVISLLVLGGVYKIFQSNSQSYRVQEELSRLQENGRFAMQLVSQDIRMAGYRGCATRTVDIHSTLAANSTDFLWGNFDIGLTGFEATSNSTWSPVPDGSIISPNGGSDILTIRKAASEPYIVTAHGNGTDPVQLDSYIGINENDVVLVSDCSDQAAVFQITDDPGSAGELRHAVHSPPGAPPGNNSNDLGKDFTGGEVSTIATTSFYVSNSTAGVPALFRRVGNGVPEELVEGVENMQILYGLDSNEDGAVDQYVSAAGVGGGNWKDVLSLRVGLLLRTVNEIHDIEADTGPYPVLGTNVPTPSDRRLRRVVETTIGIRNRMR